MENINQIPNIQPVEPIEPIQTPEPAKNKNIFKTFFIISLLVILGIIIVFYFILNNKTNNKQTVEITPVPTQIITNNETAPTTIPTIISTESTLVEKDANNNLYTNNKFGFSLVVPKTIKSTLGSCQENIPITYFENGDTIYLSDKSYFINKSCEKENTTLSTLVNNNNYQISSLKIYATNIKNDSELESYFKSKYGSGCRLGEKILSDITDIYNVKILGDGKGLDESKCPINFAVVTEYSPTEEKLVIFELGQACNFNKEPSGCYDQEILKSFKFL